MSAYETYLNRVMEENDDFKEIDGILERFKTLKKESDSLQNKASTKDQEIEDIKATMEKYENE